MYQGSLSVAPLNGYDGRAMQVITAEFSCSCCQDTKTAGVQAQTGVKICNDCIATAVPMALSQRKANHAVSRYEQAVAELAKVRDKLAFRDDHVAKLSKERDKLERDVLQLRAALDGDSK